MAAPEFSYGQVKYNGETTSVDSDGATFLSKFGLEFDFMMSDTYAFSTGLIYSPKRLSLKAENADGTVIAEEYKIQYLQLPATLKLFTSEIQPDLKAYFQIGFMGEIMLYNEKLEDDNELVDKFQFFDFSFTGGAGLEYGAGVNTIIYGGVFYDLGLVNVIKEENAPEDDLTAKMRAWSLKIGLKF